MSAIASTNTSQMFFSDIATWINETPTSKLTLDSTSKSNTDPKIIQTGRLLIYITQPAESELFLMAH